MKKLIISSLIVMALSLGVYAEKRTEIATENVVTASVTATQVAIPSNGYLTLFAKDAIYVSLTGVTENISDYWEISAKGSLSTGKYYYTSESIAVAAVSGTSTYNMIISRGDY